MRNTVMIMTITTMMMTTRMPACNVCNHAHRLSFTDGPRKGEQASGITMTATNALTNTYGGGSIIGDNLFSDAQRGACPCAGRCSIGVAVVFFFPCGGRSADGKLTPNGHYQ